MTKSSEKYQVKVEKDTYRIDYIFKIDYIFYKYLKRLKVVKNLKK